jgi:hypothetical protein
VGVFPVSHKCRPLHLFHDTGALVAAVRAAYYPRYEGYCRPRSVRGQCGGARLVPQAFPSHEDEDGEDVPAIADDGEFPPELAGGIRDAVTRRPKTAHTLQN